MIRTGNEWFFKMAGGKSKHIELTEESGRNRDILQKIKQKTKDKGKQN